VALKPLLKLGLIVLETDTTGGRPVTRVRLDDREAGR
jgi:hypothetical protein